MPSNSRTRDPFPTPFDLITGRATAGIAFTQQAILIHQIFKKKRIFKICALSIATTGETSKKFYMDAQLHFFRYTKA